MTRASNSEQRPANLKKKSEPAPFKSRPLPPRLIFLRVSRFVIGGFVEFFVVEKIWKRQPDSPAVD